MGLVSDLVVVNEIEIGFVDTSNGESYFRICNMLFLPGDEDLKLSLSLLEEDDRFEYTSFMDVDTTL